MPTAIAYLRVSTDDQAAHGHSLAAQRVAVERYCTAFGLDLLDVIADEGVSGGVALEDRPGGARLLAALRGGAVSVLAVWRLDRLFRDLIDGLLFFRDVAGPGGVAVHTVTERIDTSTAAGRLNLKVQLLIADNERDVASERTRAVMVAQREAGRVTGTVPYGLRAVGGEEVTDAAGRQRTRGAALERDPATWPVRELIVALREGRDGPALTYRGIRDELRDRGIASPTGGRWWALSSLRAVVDGHQRLPRHLAVPADGKHVVASSPDAGVSLCPN